MLGAGHHRLYTLVVYLIGGPVSGGFDGRTISRTIQIRGDRTLEALHKSVFKAFNRFDYCKAHPDEADLPASAFRGEFSEEFIARFWWPKRSARWV